MSKKIEIGDSVVVHISKGFLVHGVVEYIPCASGDCWIIDSKEDGLTYIQHFMCMMKVGA